MGNLPTAFNPQIFSAKPEKRKAGGWSEGGENERWKPFKKGKGRKDGGQSEGRRSEGWRLVGKRKASQKVEGKKNGDWLEVEVLRKEEGGFPTIRIVQNLRVLQQTALTAA